MPSPHAAPLIRRLLVLGLVAAAASSLTGCRRGGADIGPTLQPTLTPTPRSTPLPSLEPTAAPGSADNPVRVLIAAPAGLSAREAGNAAEALTETLSEAAGFTVEAAAAPSGADALAGLCDPTAGVNAAWLSAPSAAAALVLECGTPVLSALVDDEAAYAVGWYTRAEADIEDFAGLADTTVCRVSVTDADTWLIPGVLLAASGAGESVFAVREYDTAESVLAELADGACDAAGLPVAVVEAASGTVRRAVSPLGEPVLVPYPILFIPEGLPLAERAALIEAAGDLSGAGLSAWRDLTGAESTAGYEADAARAWTALTARARLDFTAWAR
jgi:ABC-type phosphate/phosphonate transport system substrate-binding protein